MATIAETAARMRTESDSMGKIEVSLFLHIACTFLPTDATRMLPSGCCTAI